MPRILSAYENALLARGRGRRVTLLPHLRRRFGLRLDSWDETGPKVALLLQSLVFCTLQVFPCLLQNGVSCCHCRLDSCFNRRLSRWLLCGCKDYRGLRQLLRGQHKLSSSVGRRASPILLLVLRPPRRILPPAERQQRRQDGKQNQERAEFVAGHDGVFIVQIVSCLRIRRIEQAIVSGRLAREMPSSCPKVPRLWRCQWSKEQLSRARGAWAIAAQGSAVRR